jgi:hypothetical protein
MESSELIEKMSAALKKYGNATGVHISITEKGDWHNSEEGVKSFIKWLCWNLFSENDEFITGPDLITVNGDIDQKELFKNVREKFAKYNCIIDNDIQFE